MTRNASWSCFLARRVEGTRKAAVSSAPQPSFERARILKAKLDHLEVNDAAFFYGVQQKVLANLIAKGHPLVRLSNCTISFSSFAGCIN
jgi:hypothetical protein